MFGSFFCFLLTGLLEILWFIQVKFINFLLNSKFQLHLDIFKFKYIWLISVSLCNDNFLSNIGKGSITSEFISTAAASCEILQSHSRYNAIIFIGLNNTQMCPAMNHCSNLTPLWMMGRILYTYIKLLVFKGIFLHFDDCPNALSSFRYASTFKCPCIKTDLWDWRNRMLWK